MIPPDRVLNLLLRGGAAGIFLSLAIALLREPRQPARLSGALFCLGGAGYAFSQSIAIRDLFGPAIAGADLMADIVCGLFWTFSIELFGDARSFRLSRYAPAAALLVISQAAVIARGVARPLRLIQLLMNIGLMIHVLVMAWSGRNDDLVESRRRLRVPLIVASALFALVVSSALLARVLGGPPFRLTLATAAIQVGLAIASALAFQNVDESFFGSIAKPAAQPPDLTHAPPIKDRATLDRLRKALDMEEAWRREDLSIGALAEMVGAPQHRLRKIINEGLGYRNFAAFLGERRVSAAKAMLSDPTEARRPVSAIAFEVGFSSLASFNRVFRDVAGTTPTAYRQAALASNSQTPPQN